MCVYYIYRERDIDIHAIYAITRYIRYTCYNATHTEYAVHAMYATHAKYAIDAGPGWRCPFRRALSYLSAEGVIPSEGAPPPFPTEVVIPFYLEGVIPSGGRFPLCGSWTALSLLVNIV